MGRLSYSPQVLNPKPFLEDELLVSGIAVGGLSEVRGGWRFTDWRGRSRGQGCVWCAACTPLARRPRPASPLPPPLLPARARAQLPPALLPVGRLSHLLAGELGVYGHRPQVLNDILAGEGAGRRVSCCLTAWRGVSGVWWSWLGVHAGSQSTHPSPIHPGKRIDLSVSANAYSRAFKGSASPVDAPELMQLIHALFTCE